MIQRDLSLYAVKAQVLAALANPRRLRIVDLLGAREKTVSELASALGAAQAATSQHLAVMRMAGVVYARTERNHVYYRPCDPGIAAACQRMGHVVVAMLVRQRERLRPALRDGEVAQREAE